ncbi:MAG: prephenate dehydratase [Actinobacteria bacterium]|nr:prephenate dehydratase [Actinomycetota bacterium]MBO0835186.1 prephenate dehydratase [Actinomycetota bacterium]
MTYRYSYLGPRGTFTEAAVRALAGSADPDALPCPSIQGTLDAVRSSEAELGVVPIESSVEGAVTATLDELAVGTEVVICAEVLVPVEFALLARPGTTLAEVRAVGGHPVAQPQCRRWLAANLPLADFRPAASNSDAAQQVAEGRLDAALAGVFAAELYGLEALATGVHDHDDAVTRFVAVRLPGPPPARTGADKTSVVAFLADDHPGALMDILGQFAFRGINLTRIESRPTGDGIGRYCFFIDCEGHVGQARVGEALMGLRRVCSAVRFLGSYPQAQMAGQSSETANPHEDKSDAEFIDAADWLARIRSGQR